MDEAGDSRVLGGQIVDLAGHTPLDAGFLVSRGATP